MNLNGVQQQKVSVRQSIKEWFIDYLVILIMLLIVALIFVVIYTINGSIPVFTEMQANLISFFTTVLPVIIVFSYMDYKGGSYGKKKAGLQLIFQEKSVWRSVIRNIIKFIPWHLGHMATISGIYSEYESLLSQVLTPISVGLLLVLMGMRFFRNDGRHIGDMIAGTQVIQADS